MAEMTFCGNTDCEFNNIVYFRGCSSPQVLNVLLCPGYRAVEEEKEAVAEQDKSEPEKSDRENLKEYLFRTKEIKDDLIYSIEAGTGWDCDFCVYTGAEAEICKECEDGSHFERQEPVEKDPDGLQQHEPKQVRKITNQQADQEIETDYRSDSLVAQKRARIKELVDAHWSYMDKVLSTGQDRSQTFTWDQVMQIRKWDYTSAATHFYGHGYEDAEGDFA